MKKTTVSILLLISMSALAAFAQETREDKLEIGGALEVPYSLLFPRTDSPAYELQYFGKDSPDILSTYSPTLYLNGDYQTGKAGVHIKTVTTVSGESDPAFALYELYGNYYPSDSSFIQAGKRTLRWGKGYAFSPVGYISPVKDPEDPEASLAGYSLINYQYSRSFSSEILNNIALDLVVLPAVPASTMKAADAEDTSAAGKFYLMVWDTDIDFMAYYGKDKPLKYGMDISRNIVGELEVHGEISRFQDQPKYTISGPSLRTEELDGFAYLVGLRWLNAWNVTTILEYYHNDAGLTRDEFLDYGSYLESAIAAGTGPAVSGALNLSKSYFGGSNLMRDYLYLKFSKPEPLGMVDTSFSIYSIYNILDRSSSAGFQIGYKPVTNLEIVFQAAVLLGPEDTEFGSKPNAYKALMEAKLSF
jgi:hypothetical protein